MIPSTPVWWHCKSRAYSQMPPGTMRADVAIIGGGLTGLSTAYHLLARRSDARVVLLEAEHIGAGASGRTT